MDFRYKIYVDGACQNNRVGEGIAAWAYVIFEGKKIITAGCDFELNSTNNRAEMFAVIDALNALAEHTERDVYNAVFFCDNTLVVDGFNKWMHRWEKNEFKDRKNVDLWKILLKQKADNHILGKWVRGHNGDEWNEFCNYVAEDYSLFIENSLQNNFV